MSTRVDRPRWRRAVLTGLTLTVLAACGDDGSGEVTSSGGASTTTSPSSTLPASTSTSSTSGADAGSDALFVCAGGPFDEDDLALPPVTDDDSGVESADGPIGDALRTLLELEEGAGRDVPDRGWRELSTDGSGEGTIHEFAHGEPPDLWIAVVQELAGGDRVQGELVEPCTPRPYREDALVAYWWPTTDVVRADDTLTVAVQEDSCDSGRGPEGRVLEPDVTYTDDAVVVTFFVRPRDEDGSQDCGSHPPATVELRLEEELGDRVLLDGSTYPARAPSDERPVHIG